ncbi:MULTISPECIES: hypothetical protein [unclassified Microcoleus]|uniref:hypothetical protein n=1 Tax=unclassified Microcoleus TaxID=2642155 RepID=UPI002FD37741
MSDEKEGRSYTGDILLDLQGISTPQIILDCGAIYTDLCGWIAQYAALPTTINPPPIFYSKPGFQFFIENLSLNYYARSLPEATAPEIKPNSTQNDKLISAKELVRNFKRFELTVLQRKNSADTWKIIGIEDLHNYGNIFNYANLKNPFLTQGAVDIFGQTTQLAVRFRDKDISRRIELPITGNDILTVRGCWRAIITL